MEKVKIEPIPVASPSERDWLYAQAGMVPVRYMTREEFAAMFPPAVHQKRPQSFRPPEP